MHFVAVFLKKINPSEFIKIINRISNPSLMTTIGKSKNWSSETVGLLIKVKSFFTSVNGTHERWSVIPGGL